jgi:hypothetical protein
MKRRSLIPRLRSHVTRRGAIFHYYMMYLFLSGMLLTTSGLCIHAILKANQVDSEIALYLQTLLRLEGDLRNDASQANGVEAQDNSATLRGQNSDFTVQWSIKDNVVKRETISDGKASTSSRYVFVRGTQLKFSWQNQQLALNIREPSPVPATKAEVETEADESSLAKSVQIVTVIAADEGGES